MRTLFLFTAAFLLALPASAEMCTLDAVPAATLLLPYFEVDLAAPDGATTIFSIGNAGPAPALAHVILWTDWGVPTVSFDVFLTGYDLVTVNLRDVFQGNVPITGDAASDPGDTTSPHGDPAWDGSFPVCGALFPFYTNPVIQGPSLDRLVNGHLGNVVAASGRVLGSDHGDGVARGYLTADSVSQCSQVLDPRVAGYFVDGGTGVVNDENVLWGDSFYVDPALGAMSAQPLVHLEADPAFDAASTATGYTFYGILAAGGGDNREPLGSVWGVRYYSGALSETDLVVWRDPTDASAFAGLLPGLEPRWWPLAEGQVVCFNETEDSVEVCTTPGDCTPLVTQRVALPALPFAAGWCYLNLNRDCRFCAPGGFGSSGRIAQSYVGTIHTSADGYAGGTLGVGLVGACTDLDPVLTTPTVP